MQPSARQNQPLRLAAANGHLAVVELLLADSRELQPAGTGRALAGACAGAHTAVAQRLLDDSRVSCSDAADDVLTGAIQSGKIELIELVTTHPRTQAAFNSKDLRSALCAAAAVGSVEATARLLAMPQLDFRPAATAALEVAAAARQGHAAIVQRIMADPRAGDLSSFALMKPMDVAAECGHRHVIDLLLPLPQLNVVPAGAVAAWLGLGGNIGVLSLCSAVEKAAEQGHVRALQRLLCDPRFNEAQLHKALIAAVRAGQVDTFNTLVAAAEGGDARLGLRSQCQRGGIRLIDREPYMIMSDCSLHSAATLSACAVGSAEIVARLLSPSLFPLGIPALDGEAFVRGRHSVASVCLYSALQGKHASVVDLLLAHPRVAPEALRWEDDLGSFPPSPGRHERLQVRSASRPEFMPRPAASTTAATGISHAQAGCGAGAEDHHHDDEEPKELDAGAQAAAAAGIGRASLRHSHGAVGRLATKASLQACLFAAIDACDVQGVVAALAHPLLDPQEPLIDDDNQEPQAGARFALVAAAAPPWSRLLQHGGKAVPAADSASLSYSAAPGPGSDSELPGPVPAEDCVAILDLLLADPCWEPCLVTAALEAVCAAQTSRATMVAMVAERLLTDPRCQLRLSLLPQRDCIEGHDAVSNTSLSHSHVMSPFEVAAGNGHAEVASLLVSEGRSRGFAAEAMGSQIMCGLRRSLHLQPVCNPTAVAAAKQVLCKAPSALTACLAALKSSDSPAPYFMRRAIDVAVIGGAAWARRRHVVASRARMLAGHGDDGDEDSSDR